MPRISVGSTSIYVERQGEGFPLFCISGLTGLAAYWEPQRVPFSRSFDLVLHDHRGVGQSDISETNITVERMAGDVVALMDTLGIDRAHIIGHSTGGAIAQSLAIDFPQRVAGLVIAGSWPGPDAFFRRQFRLRRQILNAIGPEAYVQTSTLLNYSPAWTSSKDKVLLAYEANIIANFPTIDVMSRRIDALLAFDRSTELGRISAPTLVVAAADDHVAPAYLSETLARSIPNAEFKLFPDGGHCFTQVAPREFIQAVLPFLQAHTPEAKPATILTAGH